MKCFLWFPKNVAEEPHLYLLIEDHKEYEYFQSLVEQHLRIINLKIDVTFLGGHGCYQRHLIKKAIFSSSNATIIADNWDEAFIKYHCPKFVLTQTNVDGGKENKFRFFISESELLSSTISVKKHYTGEVQREIIDRIIIKDEVSHLGIESIFTDKYIGNEESNILEIIPKRRTNSLLSFYKKIKPIADLIMVLTSFAERRRLNWYKCDGPIGDGLIESYNTRVTFYKDKRVTRLIAKFSFENFLKKTLKSIELENVKYITRLIQSYLSGMDYSVNAKIVLWNSILEKILKKKFKKKKDSLKEELLKKMSIYITDLSPIRELINIRNDIAHGDDVNKDNLFKLAHEWEILIERVLLQELQWTDLAKTDVSGNRGKPYGL
jgi:hypothetical protein